MVAQDLEGLEQLFLRLSEAGHQPGLGHHLVAAHLLGVAEHPARAEELRPAARERVEPRDGLHVVVEHVGTLGDHAGERHLLAAEVRGEHLDLAVRRHAPDRADHAYEGGGAEVGQVYDRNRVIPLVVQLEPKVRNDLETVANLWLSVPHSSSPMG